SGLGSRCVHRCHAATAVVASGAVGLDASTALTGFEQTTDLGHLCVDGPGEPATGDEVVQVPEHAVAEVHRLHVPQPGAIAGRLDLEPGVEGARHAVFQRHVDAVRCLPAIASHYRAPEATQETA